MEWVYRCSLGLALLERFADWKGEGFFEFLSFMAVMLSISGISISMEVRL